MKIKDNKNVWRGPGFGETYDLAVEVLQLIDHVLRHPCRPAPPPRIKEGRVIPSLSEIQQTIYRDDNVVAYYVTSDYAPGCEAYVVIDLKTDRVYVHSFTPEFVFDGEKIWFLPSERNYEHERGYTTNINSVIADKIEAWGCDGNRGPDGKPYVSDPHIFRQFINEIEEIRLFCSI